MSSSDHAAMSAVLHLGSTRFASVGVEVGSVATFFSADNSAVGVPRRSFDWSAAPDGTSWQFTATAAFGEGLVSIAEQGSVSGATGSRQLRIRALEDSLIMDAVIRFVAPRDAVSSVEIGPERIEHRSANRYHQRPAQPMRISLRDGRSGLFTIKAGSLPPGMQPFVYARDERDKWVFHFRTLAVRPDRIVLKGCHRLYNRSFPTWFQRLALGIPFAARTLLYVRERVSQRIPFQANGAIMLPRGAEFGFLVEWEWQ